MRIALFTYEYGPGSRGGVGRYLDQLVPFLRDNDVSVDVFHLHEHGAASGAYHVDWLHIDPDRRIANLIRRPLSESSPGAPDISAVLYDLVLCQDWNCVVASEGIWRRGAKLVYTCHMPLAWSPGWRAEIDCQYADQLEVHGLIAADAILTVSHSMAHFLSREYPYTSGKLHVVHNGIGDQFRRSSVPELYATDVAYVGRLEPSKGVQLLPEVFAGISEAHPGQRFNIVGSGSLEAELRDTVWRYGIGPQCFFYGHVDTEELSEVYARSSVLLVPSRYEPFGMVALEGMSAGVALVASSVGGLEEIVVNDESGFLVSPGDVQGYVGRVSALLGDDGMRKRIIEGGLERVRRHFMAKSSLEATLEVLEKIRNDKRAW